MSVTLPPRYANIPAALLYSDLPAAVQRTAERIWGLGWQYNYERTGEVTLDELEEICGLSRRQVFAHLRQRPGQDQDRRRQTGTLNASPEAADKGVNPAHACQQGADQSNDHAAQRGLAEHFGAILCVADDVPPVGPGQKASVAAEHDRASTVKPEAHQVKADERAKG